MRWSFRACSNPWDSRKQIDEQWERTQMKFLPCSKLRTNIEAWTPNFSICRLKNVWVVSCAFQEFSCFMLTTNSPFCRTHWSVIYTKMLMVPDTLQAFLTCSYDISLKFLLHPLACIYSLTCVRLYSASVTRIYICKTDMLKE